MQHAFRITTQTGDIHMNSFTLRAIGNLASDPKSLKTGTGEPYVKFALIGNDYQGKDKPEAVTQIFFVAFGTEAKKLANCRKGDQLFLEAQLLANNYDDRDSGEKVYGYSYIVRAVEWGAPGKITRERLAKAS